MSLRVETIQSIEGMEAIEAEWREVWRRDQAATPFEAPEWLAPWTRHLWGGGKLRVLAVRDGRELVGVAPLFLWGFQGRPPVARVSFLGTGITDHLGIVAAPERALEAARAVFESLSETRAEWHVCDLDELRPGSALLRAEPPSELIARHAPCGVCPVLALPRSMDELRAGLSSRFRKNLRQAETRLRRLGAEFRTARPDEVESAMRALFRLHAARWQHRGERGMLAGEALQRFHLEASARLAGAGLLRLTFVRLGGSIIAAQYNLWRNGRLFYYLSGFDPAQARFSPGAALLAWTIESAIAEGGVEVDFLRHREEYKYQWGARDRVNRKLLVSHTAARARDVA